MSESAFPPQPADARSRDEFRPGRPARTSPAVSPPTGSGQSVTRLGPGRWRVVSSLPDNGPDLEVYLSPAEGGVIQAARRGDRQDVCIEGMLGEAGVANLGDCLVAALERGVAHIAIELAEMDQEMPLAVEGMLESLARLTARQGGLPRMTLSGDGPAASALTQAVARGLAQGHQQRPPTGGRP